MIFEYGLCHISPNCASSRNFIFFYENRQKPRSTRHKYRENYCKNYFAVPRNFAKITAKYAYPCVQVMDIGIKKGEKFDIIADV